MNVFTEHPWWIAIGGLVIEVMLGIALARSGRRAVLATMMGVLAVTATLVFVERMIVTEREQVETALQDLARALARNDTAAVVEAISPSKPGVRTYAEQTLKRLVVKEAKVGGDLEVTVNPSNSPPLAIATFTGHLNFKDTKGEVPYSNFMEKFEISFQKEGDRWLITDHKFKPRKGR